MVAIASSTRPSLIPRCSSFDRTIACRSSCDSMSHLLVVSIIPAQTAGEEVQSQDDDGSFIRQWDIGNRLVLDHWYTPLSSFDGSINAATQRQQQEAKQC